MAYIKRTRVVSIHYNSDSETHREDGPAIIWNNGHRVWVRQSITGRKNGPALERPNGHKEWFDEGERVWPEL